MVHAIARQGRLNHLLSMLSADDLGLLEPYLEPIALPLRFALEDIGKPIKHIYFPDGGIVSVVAKSVQDVQIEVGIIGREGMTGLNVVMGNNLSANAVYMQVEGHGLRVKADDLRAAMRHSASLRDCFLHFAQAFMSQMAHTSLANGRAKVEERLARWLLMAHDRLDGDELPLTHEFLALMLSVRRPGVTVALHLLESRGLILIKRGLIQIVDREGLEELIGGMYGIPEAEYRRLTGWRGRAAAAR